MRFCVNKKKHTFETEYFLLWSYSSELSLHHHTHLAKIISSRLSVPWDTHQSLYQIYRRISCLMLLDTSSSLLLSTFAALQLFKLWFPLAKLCNSVSLKISHFLSIFSMMLSKLIWKKLSSISLSLGRDKKHNFCHQKHVLRCLVWLPLSPKLWCFYGCSIS